MIGSPEKSCAGDFLPTHDATTNVLLPGRILASQTVTFTPEDYPFMFQWKLLIPGIEDPIYPAVEHWNQTLTRDPTGTKNITAWMFYEGELLTVHNHRHYLIPVDQSTVEFFPSNGLGTALTTLPIFLLGHILFDINLGAPNLDLFLWSKCAASMLVSAGIVWLWMALCLMVPRRAALVLASAAAFGTSVWSLASQALSNQASAFCFTNCALYWMIRFTLQVRFASYHIKHHIVLSSHVTCALSLRRAN
jgi:hypothetical protein